MMMLFWAAGKDTEFSYIHCVPGQLVCFLRRGRGKWLLESRQTCEQLSAEGNFFLMPNWAQSPLCGRLEKGFLADFAPSLILTKYLLCITWQALHPTLVFPGQRFEQFGAICVPFGWTRAMPHSAGSCWCLWDFATRLHRVVTYAVGATFHFNNSFTATAREAFLHMCTYVCVRPLTLLNYVLYAYPFNLKVTKGKCAKFLHLDVTIVP